MAVIRCPNCGKPNPDFLEVCQYCDAKLHTADGAPVDSRPPSSAEDTLAPGSPPAAGAPSPKAEPEPEEDNAQPLGWMDRLRKMQAGEALPAARAAADEPDWMWTGTLREPGQPKTKPDDIPIPAPSESSADLPEWLRDLDESRDTAAEPPAAPAPSLPPAAPATPVTHSELPITPAAPPAPAAAIPSSQLPTTPAAPPSAAPSEPSPFEPTASDVTIPPRSRRKMTDWLNKLQELPPPAAPQEPEAPVIPNTDSDLPDWLKAMAAEAETPGSATPAVEAATQHLSPSAAKTPEDELPDWLRALRAKTEAPRPAPGTAALQNRPAPGTANLPARRNQELPETLRPPAADDTLVPRAGAKPLDTASEDMPDWLKGILSPTAAAADDRGAAADHPVILTGPAADAARKPGGSRPIASAPAAREAPVPEPPPAPATTPQPPAGMPTQPAPAITNQAAPPASPPAPPAPAIDDTLPPPSRRGKRLTDWLGKKPPVAASPAPADELPDWLKALSAESAAKDARTQQADAAVPAEQLPDWLKTTPPGASAAAPEPTATPTVPEPPVVAQPPMVAQPPAASPAAPAAPDQAIPATLPAAPTIPAAATLPAADTAALPAEDLPDWLKAMAPAEAAPASASVATEPAAPTVITPEPASALAATTPTQPAEATPAEDLPAWLKDMQPGAAAAELPAVPPPATPAAAVTPVEDLPDWLRAMAAPEPATAPTAPPAPPVEAPAPVVPPPMPIQPPAAAAAAPADDLPDWLKAITQDAATHDVLANTVIPVPASPAPAPEPAPAAAEDLPDWLKALTAAPSSAAATAEPPAAAPPVVPVPLPPPPAAATAQPAVTTPLPTVPEPAGADEMPDWLKAITQSEHAEPPAPATAAAGPVAPRPTAIEPPVTAPLADASEDLPDWLKAITQASSAAATAAASETISPAASQAAPAEAATAFDAETTLAPGTAAPAGPAGTPPATAPPEAEPAPAGEPASSGVTLPPWLVGVGTAPLPEAQELPDLDAETLAWLSDSKKAETTPEPAALDLASTKLPADKPAWLDELAAVTPPQGQQPAAPADIAPTAPEDMPEWLRNMRGQAGEDAVSSESTPDWLRALRGQGQGAAEPTGTPAPSAPTAAATGATTPAAPAGTPAAAAAVAGPAELTQAALPAWLAAMRPVDIEQPAATEADSYEETLGVLAGMRGVLRAEPVVAQPHKATAARQSVAISDSNTAQVNILTDLLRPAAAAPASRRGRVALGAHAERWVIFALLLIALVLAQFQAQLGLPALFSAPAPILAPETLAVYSLVQAAPTNKPALVAFDYDAAQAGELSPGAQAVVGQLAHRGVAVVAVSLQLTGPALAQQVLSQSANSKYVNLGYIPGGPVGLLQFAADPTTSFPTDFLGHGDVWASANLASVRSLADFGLIVLVSGTPESTRAWIEQAQSYAAGVPMVAVISAGAEPMLRPYYDDPNANSEVAGHLPLKGLVVGLGGAAAYEQATSAPGTATALWPALGGGLLAAAAIILLGNLIFGVLGALRRRRA